jgi:hypothetical protein
MQGFWNAQLFYIKKFEIHRIDAKDAESREGKKACFFGNFNMFIIRHLQRTINY